MSRKGQSGLSELQLRSPGATEPHTACPQAMDARAMEPHYGPVLRPYGQPGRDAMWVPRTSSVHK